EKANGRLLFASLIGPAVLVAWAVQRLDPSQIHFGWPEGWLVFFVAVAGFLAARSGTSLLKDHRHYLEGLAAERATAQELTLLIAKGCAIYHDIPAEKFNLDHVVIGPCAVFMVETKSQQKPAERGAANARVTYDGAALVFPDWRDTKMLDQTRAQTRWLDDYLYRKTGERVGVEPVLALPGWYVTKSGPPSDVQVINPRMHNFMADSKGQPIPEAQRRRIMTAIEERYPRSE
ncbi:MAG: nuclease-related domain-containing protein, partial [Rudaea sp.]